MLDDSDVLGAVLGSRGGPRTLADAATESIQELILAGYFEPGARLRIEDLASRLDMSPMPIREALRRLDALGFVEHIPHRGARVRPLSIEDLHDVYSARLPLETLAVRRAAERFTARDEAKAADCLEAYVRASAEGEYRRARQLHSEFHFALYVASGSHWLVKLIRPLFENAERYRVASLPTRGSTDQLQAEHSQILNACIEHDPDEAAQALHDHLTRTANVLSRAMDRGDIL